MKANLNLVVGLAVVGLLAGCATPLPPGAEPGPNGTMAYLVTITSTEPDTRIVANGQTVGNAPVKLKIFGDRDGTFHDFGAYEYIIQAFPTKTNQYVQTRIFGTGKMFSREDRIPPEIHFDMNRPPPPPPLVPPSYYYPPPNYYYYPGPYYYGPSFYYHHGYYYSRPPLHVHPHR